MKHVALLLFSTVFLIFSTLATADETKTLKLATLSFPPLLHTSKTGQFSGTMGETIKFMCRKANLKCIVDILPFNLVYQKLENNEIDGLITINVPQFQDCCIASTWASPWASGFFSPAPLDEIPQIPDDILGRSIIIVNGMKSPYVFMPNLKDWENEGKVKVLRAPSILSAAKMLGNDKAKLLWGSEDFNWYFEKLGTKDRWNFIPLVVRPVVVWVKKEKRDLLERLNAGYEVIQKEKHLNSHNILNYEIMEQFYVDAPFEYE